MSTKDIRDSMQGLQIDDPAVSLVADCVIALADRVERLETKLRQTHRPPDGSVSDVINLIVGSDKP